MRIVWRGQKQYAGDVTLDPNIPKDVSDSVAERILDNYRKYGLVELVTEEPSETRDVEAPPSDRMIRKPARKRGRKR